MQVALKNSPFSYPFGSLKPLRYSGSNDYRFGFNGMEVDNEVKGDNNSLDFGARIYDPRLGRWLSTDPREGDLPSWSTYAYGLDNPIVFIDPDGQFPYTFHIRSFHPDLTFGGGFLGDNRGYSNDPNSSARIAQRFTFDPSTEQASNRGFANNFSMHPAGIVATKGAWGFGKATPSETHFNVSGENGSYEISTGYAGANSLISLVSPDIDVHSNFSISENLEKGILSINASITGDHFPSSEAFVVDQSGKNSVFIGVSGLGKGSLMNLFGDNYRDMSSANFNINIDGDGNFTGVSVGEKSFTIGEWNTQFQSTEK